MSAYSNHAHINYYAMLMRNMSEGFFLFFFCGNKALDVDSGMASEESGHGVAYQRVHVEGPFESQNRT